MRFRSEEALSPAIVLLILMPVVPDTFSSPSGKGYAKMTSRERRWVTCPKCRGTGQGRQSLLSRVIRLFHDPSGGKCARCYGEGGWYEVDLRYRDDPEGTKRGRKNQSAGGQKRKRKSKKTWEELSKEYDQALLAGNHRKAHQILTKKIDIALDENDATKKLVVNAEWLYLKQWLDMD
jgi:hypothetical protein